MAKPVLLVVDDDADVLKAIEHDLRGRFADRYRIMGAHSGAEALEALEHCRAHHQMVALTRASLARLRAALVRDAGPAAATYLQEAGYAGGEALSASFAAWCHDRGIDTPEDLDGSAFEPVKEPPKLQQGWADREPPPIDAVCPIGSGDALTAAYTWRMEQPGANGAEALRWGVAAGTASALLPGMNFATLQQTAEMYRQVEVRRVE